MFHHAAMMYISITTFYIERGGCRSPWDSMLCFTFSKLVVTNAQLLTSMHVQFTARDYGQCAACPATIILT